MRNKIYIQIIILLSFYSIQAQVTYTAFPNSLNSASCPPSAGGGACSLTFASKYKLHVTSISGSTITCSMSSVCSASSLSTGTFYLKDGTECGTQITSWSVPSTSGPYTFSFNVSHIGTKIYTVTNTSSSGSRFYSNSISVTGNHVDLKCSNVSIAPPNICPGTTFSMSHRLENIGNSSSGSSNVGYYLSTNSTLDASDIYLGQSAPYSTPAAGTFISVSTTLTMPSNTAAGTNYYIFCKADNNNSVTESNETNNVDYMPAVTVLNGSSPSLRASSCFALNASSIPVGGNLTGTIGVGNLTSCATWSGTVTLFITNSGGTTIQQTILTQSLTLAGGNSQTLSFNVPLTVSNGTYRLWCQYTNPPGGGTAFLTNNGCTTCSGIGCLSTTSPMAFFSVIGAPILTCGAPSITPSSPIQGQSATFSFPVSNTGTANYPSALSLQIKPAPNGSATNLSLNPSYPGNIMNGSSFTFSHTSGSVSSAPGSYILEVVNSSGTPICSTSLNIIAPSTPNLVCGAPTITPTNPIQGQPYSFSYPITNSGTAAYTGPLYLKWRNAIAGNTLVTHTTGIPANGGNHIFTHTNTNLTSAPGTWYLQIEDASGGVICTKTVTVVSAPTCVTWTNKPTGDPLTATEYLCSNNIIQASQNGTTNSQNYVTREQLAKITYLGLYKGIAINSPARFFPVPFNDMQNSSSDWIDAVKTLAYLQYSDDMTPFDRDFINFRPSESIARKHAMKVFLEAFNYTPSSSSNTPFTDVNTTDKFYGYIKRAHELGIVSGGQFRQNDYLTREEAFIILWKMLSIANILKPSSTQLGDINNYFIPNNLRYATMAKVPDIDQGNFNHYQKTSFSIPGRGVSLDFTHTYNSFLTELPNGYFDEDDENTGSQKFTPLGKGWTHTYNIYAQKIDTSDGNPPRLIFYYPDGSINVYNYNTLACENIGVYDAIVKSNISGGEQLTITTKGQVKYVFENFNNGKFYFIKSIKDRNNNGVKCTWSPTSTIPSVAKYRLTAVQEEYNNGSIGRSLTIGYISTISPFISSVTDNSIGRTISFIVNPSTKNLTSYTNAKGKVTTYEYAPSTYTTANLLTRIILPKGNKIENTYQNRKLTASKTFAANGVVSSNTQVNWQPQYSATAYNSSAIVTDANNKNTTYQHNTLGNPTSIVSPKGTTAFNSYDAGKNANLPTSITVNGQSSSISYDSKSNILQVAKNGISHSFTYTTMNDVATHTDGRGHVTTYAYDANGNLTSIQRPSGLGSTTIARNSFGQVQSVTNPANIQTTFGYNTNGLTNQITLPLGISTSASYDNASRLTSSTDARGKTTNYFYDAHDNLTQATDASGGVIQHTYDDNDNHLSIKNPKNEIQSQTYNFDDDMLATESFGSHTKSYTYNVDGTLATFTRGSGTYTYTYDAATGRMTGDGHTSYTYDNRGNVKTVSNSNGTLTMYYDVNDRLDYYTDYYGNTVDYGYDNSNNVTTITYPGSKTVTYAYDAANRCTSITDWNSKTTTYTYLADDRVSKITLPNGSYTDYSYDAAGRMTGIVNKKANGTMIGSYTFTLDNSGNHLSETITDSIIDSAMAVMTAQATTYGAYPFNRIASQNSTTYTHNTAGGIANKGSDTYTYDINDNLLTVSGSLTANFKYDGAGNRREKTVSGITTRYLLSILGMSQVLMETNGTNIPQNYYVYGPTGLLYRVKSNGSYQYYHYDYRGSTTAMTNDAQQITHSYSYDPYGNTLVSKEADPNPFRYVGQHGVMYESPNLTFMRARYYDPSIGRFLSEDPIWAMNLYPYADGNPVNNIDPKGEQKIDVSNGDIKTLIDVADPLLGGVIPAPISIATDMLIGNESISTAKNKNDKTLEAINFVQSTAIGLVASTSGPVAPVISFGANSLNKDINIMAQSKSIQDAVKKLDNDGSLMWKGSQQIGKGFEKLAKAEINLIKVIYKKTGNHLKKRYRIINRI